MATEIEKQALNLPQYTLATRDRPLKLALAYPGGVREDMVLPQRIVGHDAMFDGFAYTVLCITSSAILPLKDFIGLPAELRIVTDRGRLRRICGIVTEAASGQSDGALATYQLVVRDALSIMGHRTNTRVFRNQSELDIVRTLVTEWQQRNGVLCTTFDLQVEAGLDAKLPQREFIMQHNESDAAFVKRLLQRRGISWFFQSGLPQRGGSQGQPAGIGHTLVLFTDPNQLAQNAAGRVRFHRDAATEQRDSITAWSAVRTLQPGGASLYSPNYKEVSTDVFTTTRAQSQNNQGEMGNKLSASLEAYHVAAPHIGDSARDFADIGDAQMAYYEYEAKCFRGEGGVRDMAVGEWFSFEGHPEIDTHPAKEREFVVIAQEIATQNNLPVEIGGRVERLFNRNGWNRGEYAVFASGEGKPIGYQTRFTCVRRGIRIMPPRATLPQPSLQTAIVVGPINEEVWCDELGRVKIRFPSVRPEDHAHASGAGSSGSDRDSAWVRVASNWAGSALGAHRECGTRFLPPVGTEVLVDFAGGDPDKPIVIGQLYNGAAPPPAFQNEAGLPSTKYQSGIRSREAHGKRGNQLRLDDTPGQISAQLASDHASAEINLGYLTELRQGGVLTPRGEGVELRSDEAIALHAARGILLNAWKLLGGARGKGKQLARQEYLQHLQECGELFASLGNYAAEHGALASDAKEQEKLQSRFKDWENGSNTIPNASERGEPVIGITSAAGIGFASGEAIVSYSATNIDTVAQQHLQLTAGQRFNLNAGKGISLFAQNGGLTGIAHTGKLQLQSQHDDTDIHSAKNLTLTASEGTATIAAKVILLVAEDGSFLKLGDGPPVIGSKQPLKFHAPDFLYEAPETMTAQFPQFGNGGADQKFVVRYAPGIPLDTGERPPGAIVKNAKLNIALSDGTSMQARSDAHGKSELIARDAMHMAEVGLMRGGDQ
jgi:type VI secretion system secreted protein VgrG